MPRRFALIGNQAFSMLRFRSSLIAALVARNVELFALAPDYTEEHRAQIRSLGAEPVDYRMQRNGINPVQDGVTILSLVAALRAINPDYVLSYAIKPAVYGTLAAALSGVPNRFVLIEGLGHVFISRPNFENRVLKSVVLILYRAALGLTAETFFLNEDDKADFLANRLVPNKKATVIGAIGLDLRQWTPTQQPIQDPVTFTFIGRLLREKGIIEFVQAARVVKARHAAARFIILGDVDTNPSSVERTQVQGWVEEGLIEWPGHVNVKEWLAQSSVFVLPSYREGMPRSTQEAMAMGLPVITTDVPGCRETVEKGQNGYLVAANSPGALAEAMLKFIASPDKIQKMGKRSREIAEFKFDENVFNERIIRLMNVQS